MTAANVTFEPFWPSLFAKALTGLNIKDLITNVGAASMSGGGGGAAPGGGAEEAKGKSECS